MCCLYIHTTDTHAGRLDRQMRDGETDWIDVRQRQMDKSNQIVVGHMYPKHGSKITSL